MSKVSREWVLKHVKTAYRNGQPFNLNNFKDRVTGFDTTLTPKGVLQVQRNDYRQKFEILVPNIGWIEAFPLM
jgi:hypothetical protein